MKLKLYGIPGSHNVAVAEAMIRHKGFDFDRRDLIPGAHVLLVRRVLGFSGGTVPALRVDHRRFHGVLGAAKRDMGGMASQVRVLLGLDDLRPFVERHKVSELAAKLFPDFKGRLKSVFSESELAGFEAAGAAG